MRSTTVVLWVLAGLLALNIIRGCPNGAPKAEVEKPVVVTVPVETAEIAEITAKVKVAEAEARKTKEAFEELASRVKTGIISPPSTPAPAKPRVFYIPVTTSTPTRFVSTPVATPRESVEDLKEQELRLRDRVVHFQNNVMQMDSMVLGLRQLAGIRSDPYSNAGRRMNVKKQEGYLAKSKNDLAQAQAELNAFLAKHGK